METFEGFTPGPWRVEEYDDGSMSVAPHEGFAVCTMAIVPPARIAANAKLIAAAPELLAQRDALLAAFNRVPEPPSDFDKDEGVRAYAEAIMAWLDECPIVICRG